MSSFRLLSLLIEKSEATRQETGKILIKKVGISREMLHRHISKEEMVELKELRKTCQSIGMDKIKQKGLKGNV